MDGRPIRRKKAAFSNFFGVVSVRSWGFLKRLTNIGVYSRPMLNKAEGKNS